MSDLYRREAVEHANQRLSGVVVMTSSVSSRLLTIAALLIVAVVALFAGLSTYSRKETVSGFLTPPAGLIRVAARQGGVIERLHVAEGDIVDQGQIIATMRLSEVTAGGDTYLAASRNLQIQREAALEQGRLSLEDLRAERAQLADRRRGLAEEMDQARLRGDLQRQRLQLAQAEVQRAETVAAQGFLPGRELELRRSSALQAEQTLSEITAIELGLRRQIREVNAQLAELPRREQQVQAQARTEEADLNQRATTQESQATYLVVAPLSGRIAALPGLSGRTLSTGGVVGVITPVDAPLEAEIYAPSRAAGFIRPGQSVRIMYQAFPFQKFGVGRGRVLSVSRTVLAPEEVAMPGLNLTEPVFRVRVALERMDIEAYGQSIPLQAGMTLSADIVVERRNLLEWLFDPLYAAGRRS
ncbi:MAG: HlyD family secretion protein [Brevundimonas aurantiaca]|uniref:HlyD family secretion protein n=1 Tax=Brevundimonas aurantiaca TaxID=74316 RepID=UPI004034BFA5